MKCPFCKKLFEEGLPLIQTASIVDKHFRDVHMIVSSNENESLALDFLKEIRDKETKPKKEVKNEQK